MTANAARTTVGWRARGLALVPMIACAAWALWPLSRDVASAPSPPRDQASSAKTLSAVPKGAAQQGLQRTADQVTDHDHAISLASFQTPLWVVPPPPPPPPPTPEPVKPAPPPPPPPAFKWQLISITRENGGGGATPSYAAVFYDPQADRLVNARAGDEVTAGRRVESVFADRVEIRQQFGTSPSSLLTLRLREARDRDGAERENEDGRTGGRTP